MKLSTFTQAVILMLLIAFAASCGTSRSTTEHPRDRYPNDRRYPDERSTPPGHAKKTYGHRSAKVFAPGQRRYEHYPLIITRGPGMYITRNRDGRYFYKNNDGYYYWQGYDQRFYLDERHLSQTEYDRYSYEDWRDRGKSNANRYKRRKY
ncbi:MAG: hypothetical protein H7122_00805 [Chitinophagaceae bacterium]|nr:hypothetical protein [Chitinophagaceae bacterium]